MPNVQKNFIEGEPFAPSAAQFNRWQRSAEWTEARRNSGGPVDAANAPATTTVIEFTTAIPTALPIGGVVAIVSPVIEPKNDRKLDRLIFTAGLPNDSDGHNRRLAILAEPANPGTGIYRAYVGGMFPARIKIAEGPGKYDGSYATGDPGKTNALITCPYGPFHVIWRSGPNTANEDGDGGGDVRWAIITPTTPLRTKPTAKYQVLTPISDSLEPVWTELRVQS